MPYSFLLSADKNTNNNNILPSIKKTLILLRRVSLFLVCSFAVKRPENTIYQCEFNKAKWFLCGPSEKACAHSFHVYLAGQYRYTLIAREQQCDATKMMEPWSHRLHRRSVDRTNGNLLCHSLPARSVLLFLVIARNETQAHTKFHF